MKSIIFVLLCVASCSCGSKKPSSAENAKVDSPARGKQDTGTITLDKEAQRKGHITVISLEDRAISETISAPGQLTTSDDRTWHVGAIAAGKIESVNKRVGDPVRAGEILARIHSHDVHETRAAYSEASSELDRARSANAYATKKRDRARRLLELKAGSRQDVESAEAEVTNAQAQIDKAQAELLKERIHLTDILHVAVDGAGAPGTQHGDDTQDGIPVYAPASGVVFERKATMGSVVTEGDVLFTIADTSSLWMIAAANEADLSRFRAGQNVLVEVKAYPEREFHGRVLKLGEQLNSETRTLQIRIQVQNPGGLLKPEMYATATLQQAGSRRSLLVPEEAVQDINGVPAVFVRPSPDRFEPRPVKAGRHANGQVEILEGLKAGEAIVVKGSFLIKSQMLKSAIQEN